MLGFSSDAGDSTSARPRTHRSRRSLLRISGGLGVALLAGGTPTSRSGRTSGTTRVRLWSWLTDRDQYVAALNSSQRDARVELSVVAAGTSGGCAQQTNAIRVHTAPDIPHVEHQALPQNATTVGLRESSAEVDDLADGFLTAARQSVRPGGKTCAVPMNFCPMAFFHHKDLFDGAGIEVPRNRQEFRPAASADRRAPRPGDPHDGRRRPHRTGALRRWSAPAGPGHQAAPDRAGMTCSRLRPDLSPHLEGVS